MDDMEVLEAALTGFERRREELDEKITELRSCIAKTDRRDHARPRKRRPMSAAARARIAKAQRKRWKEFHRNQRKK